MRHRPFVLASASPRRAELLRAAGFDFEIIPGTADETMLPNESPDAYVTRVAGAKAATVREVTGDRVVLAADTTVVVDDLVLGKPVDDDDARRMLGLLSGRTHRVLTGICLVNGAVQTKLASTLVEFAPMSAEEIEWYVRSGEPMDKAGAYAIQGRASRFVRQVIGSYSNVVGLPIALVYEMLEGRAA